jgi:DNA-binding Lrp family transcriptional regulator
MRRAFVLINVELGSDDAVESELKKIQPPVQVYQVYGVYDLMVQVTAESDKQLKDIIFTMIRSLHHVKSTLTLSVVE